MKAIDVFCHLMPRRYAELAMEESPNQSHMFVRALKMQAMSDMEYRKKVMCEFPGYKQIPNIVSPPVEAFAGPDNSPRLAEIGYDEIKKIIYDAINIECFERYLCKKINLSLKKN